MEQLQCPGDGKRHLYPGSNIAMQQGLVMPVLVVLVQPQRIDTDAPSVTADHDPFKDLWTMETLADFRCMAMTGARGSEVLADDMRRLSAANGNV